MSVTYQARPDGMEDGFDHRRRGPRDPISYIEEEIWREEGRLRDGEEMESKSIAKARRVEDRK